MEDNISALGFINHCLYLFIRKTYTGKTIGYLGAFAIGVNSLCGPALLQLPYQFQQSGLIPTTICLILVGILSSFVTLHMCNVVSKVPGNAQFDKTVEFSDPFSWFWSRKAFLATQIIFYFCTISLNIAAIIDLAGVVDSFLGHTVGSYAFAPNQLFDQPVQEWHHGPCTRSQVKKGVCEPFDGIDIHNGGHEYSNYLITLGYVIAAAVFLPICLMDLKVRTYMPKTVSSFAQMHWNPTLNLLHYAGKYQLANLWASSHPDCQSSVHRFLFAIWDFGSPCLSVGA